MQELKMSKITKIILGVFIGLIVVCGGVIAIAMTTIDNIKSNPISVFDTRDNNNPPDAPENKEIVINGVTKQASQGICNILLMGIDSNSVRVSKAKGKRSDMLILCSVNFDKKKISLVSIPRDTYTQIYKLDHDGNVVSTYNSKITNAYSTGGTDKYHGAENSMRCVQELLECDGKLSVPINYYCSIDMDGITAICDALDGVDVTLDMDMHLMDLTEGAGSKLQSGSIGREGETVTLKGDEAIMFVRMRHGIAGGDFARTRHQQQFIIAIMKKIQEMGAYKAAPKIYDEFMTFAKTNLNLDQVLSLSTLLDDIQIDDIEFSTLEGKSTSIKGAGSVVVLDEDAKYQKIADLMYD